MRQRSCSPRRLVAGLCIVSLLCLALAAAGPGLPSAILPPVVAWLDPGCGAAAPGTGDIPPAASEGRSAAAPRAPPRA
jgi:hypothetical protein